jgi:hypothetical protein
MNNEYIWSKGPLASKYSEEGTEICGTKEDIEDCVRRANETGIMWLRCGSTMRVMDITMFASYIQLLTRDVILITTDGDRPIPQSLSKGIVQKFLNSNRIKIWYTQNFDGTVRHPKLRLMPIGFDLHFPETFINGQGGHNKFHYMLKLSKICTNLEKEASSNFQKKMKIYGDFNINYTHPERKYLHEQILNLKINNDLIDLQDKKISFKAITRKYNEYCFAISPRGGGLDCHRTWELLLAGAIVITRSSSLDQMYIDNQLPVVILDSWDQLFQPNLKDKMQEWKEQYSEWTKLEHILPRLRFDWWIKS